MKILSLAALLCAALPAWAVPVSVTIVGPDDKPLAGAKISRPALDAQAKTLESRDIAGENGVFKFEWDGQFPAPGTAPDAPRKLDELILVRVQAPGMATEFSVLEAPDTTIKLKPGRIWSGVVLDQNENPVAGVHVRWENPLVPVWTIEAVTDERGRWQMNDLSARGDAQIALSDPRFVAASYAVKIVDGEAPPLFVQAAATIKGQMLRPDGAPIVGAPVVAEPDYYRVVRTDAQGRFTLTGVKPGTVRLVSLDVLHREPNKPASDPGYLVTTRDKVSARAGETTDIGAWTMPRGALITLRVVDAATGKPIEGVSFSSWAGHGSSPSDAAGRIWARILPGEDTSGPELGSVFSDNYVGKSVPRPPKLAQGATDLGTIKLQRGTRVSGRVRISGKTFENSDNLPQLALGEINNFIGIWVNPANGFQTQPLAPGNYQLNALDDGMPSKNWQFVSPATLTVSAKADDKPLEIIIKSLKPWPAAPKPLREVRGRLLDANGQGVSGAVVNVATPVVLNSQSIIQSQVTAVTDRDGNWSAPLSYRPTSIQLKSVQRPGYGMSGTSRSVIQGDVAVVSGVSLKRRGAIFAGRVLDANGQPVANAWVAVLEARDFAPVQTGADGSFALRDVPLEKFTLLATQGFSWAQMPAASSASGIELRLQKPRDYNRDLVDQALEGRAPEGQVLDYWEILGTARMERLWGGAQWGNTFALELARRDPASFARRAPELMRDAEGEPKAELEARWNWARAQAGDADQRIAANAWVDERVTGKRGLEAQSVTELLRVAAVAHALGRADADELSDYAAAIAAQLGGGSENNAEAWGALSARSGYAATASLAEGLKPIAELKLWWTATGILARAGEFEGAKAAIARMETLAQTPAWMQHTRLQSWDDPAPLIDQVRGQVARALAPTDLAGAAAIAEDIGEDFERTKAQLAIADAAIAKGDKVAAETALRVAMKGNYANPEHFALAASLAQEVSPQLGAELWADALGRTLPAQGSDFSPSVAMWAFYHARLDPAQSRVLIEREWSWRLPALAVKPPREDVGTPDLDALEMAMSAVDPARAGEMRAEARRKVKLKPQANIGLATALLMNDAQRARWGVDSMY